MAASGKRPRLRTLKAVLFDVLGTLVFFDDPAPALRHTLDKSLGLARDEESVRAAFRAEMRYYVDHHLEGTDRGSLRHLRRRCAQIVCDYLDIDEDKCPQVQEALLSCLQFRAFSDAFSTLDELRAHGLRLVATSNWDCSLPEVLDRIGLLPLLDAVVCSAEVGAAKPDPRMFATALRKANCSAAHAAHVGDTIDTDVLGAQAAGVEAVLIQREAEAGGWQPPRAVKTIRALGELPALIFN
jgi:putative hydrolase of the HAD superfamily